jgi:excisionase family DNA binding protein
VKKSPALRSVKDTEHHLGLGHTTIYSLIAQGKLVAVKLGAKTLITNDSIDAFIEGLPRADIRAPKAKAA